MQTAIFSPNTIVSDPKAIALPLPSQQVWMELGHTSRPVRSRNLARITDLALDGDTAPTGYTQMNAGQGVALDAAEAARMTLLVAFCLTPDGAAGTNPTRVVQNFSSGGGGISVQAFPTGLGGSTYGRVSVLFDGATTNYSLNNVADTPSMRGVMRLLSIVRNGSVLALRDHTHGLAASFTIGSSFAAGGNLILGKRAASETPARLAHFSMFHAPLSGEQLDLAVNIVREKLADSGVVV